MEEENELSHLVFYGEPKKDLPEIFGRRKGYSNPKYPCFLHIHHANDLSVHYMDEDTCVEFNTTLDHIKSFEGTDFLDLVTHEEDAGRVKQLLRDLINDRDENKLISYFQRIKLRPEKTQGYNMVLTSARFDVSNNLLICMSNSTDQTPLLSKKVSLALNSKHELQQKATYLLSLTPRERDVMELVIKGDSAEEIANILHLSEYTITQHKKNIYKKLHVNSIAELMQFTDSFTKS